MAEVATAKREAAEDAREKEQLKHTLEMSRLQSKADDLNRQLEKKSCEQFGEEVNSTSTTNWYGRFRAKRLRASGVA
jgi:hypothetical protein